MVGLIGELGPPNRKPYIWGLVSFSTVYFFRVIGPFLIVADVITPVSRSPLRIIRMLEAKEGGDLLLKHCMAYAKAILIMKDSFYLNEGPRRTYLLGMHS